MTINQYGQPVGDPLPLWQPCAWPAGKILSGNFCRLQPLEAERDFMPLFNAYQQAPDGRDWTYLMVERPESAAAMRAHLEMMQANSALVNLVVIDQRTQAPVGTVAFMRIDQANGVLEIGHVSWSPLMQRRPSATEAIYLMLRYAFSELGYRRCEWKCDSLNAPSRQAAQRFGFSYEGRFSQAIVTKGRSRDTDWFAITDVRWPAIGNAFECWLSGENFTAEGQQKKRLRDFIVETA